MEYFIRHAGSCLKVWNKIIGQEITHKGAGTGIVVGIDKTDSGILVKVRFHAGRPPTVFLGSKRNLLRVFTSLKLPKEIEKELEKHHWDLEKEGLLDQLRHSALECAIDESIHATFESIVEELRRMHQQCAFSEETIQQIKRYQRQFIDRMRFTDMSETAMYPSVMARFPLPELDERDIQLVAGHWWNSASDSLDRKSLMRNHEKDYNLGRLLSARSAEKVALDFYKKYGKKVSDISISQLDNNNYDWKNADLYVDGLPVDVKNSRKSQNSKDRYTEHYVQKFKQNRKNQDVTITGVFSPYLSAYELLDQPTVFHQYSDILLLGETSLAKQFVLEREFYPLCELGDENFLPPWVFDYPAYVYTKQNKVRRDLKDFPNLGLLKEAKFEFNLLPVCVATGIDFAEVRNNVVLSRWEKCFLKQLRLRTNRYGLSLPFLFLTVLEHFLEMAASSKSDANFHPEKYRRFLFCEDTHRPLGIYDPLKTIDALLEALDTLWTAENGLIRKFRIFKLRSFNVLQGKSDSNDNLWTTLIAYCGGHLEKDGSACGKNPLVLGESELCRQRRLICPEPECGYCCPSCKSGVDGWTPY